MLHPPSDIRSFIPQVKPGAPYEHQEYPKMMTKEEKGKHVAHTHKDGRPVIVHSKEEEEAFLEAHGGSDKPVEEDTTGKKRRKLED